MSGGTGRTRKESDRSEAPRMPFLRKLRSKISTRRLRMALRFALILVPAIIMKAWLRNVWLVAERPEQARDNGYCFFRFLRTMHPELRVCYIIKENTSDCKKVSVLGETIRYNSWKHLLFFCAARIHISSHVGGCCPPDAPFIRYFKPLLGFKDIFLPHGVSYGVSEFCLAKYAKIDLFITSGKPEYENVLANYGYTKDQVVYTGFPRLDGWHHLQVNPKQLVLMPTWRLYLAQNPDTVIEKTAYFQTYQSLINSSELGAFLAENGLKLVFYLHHNMRPYVNAFHTECPQVQIVYRDEDCDIQELLKESALLITDYSSVHFDFAYMGKPVLYYQFDREEFWQKQYKQTDFDAAKNGFGPVAYDEGTLIALLKQAYAEGFRLQGEYERRMKAFYVLRDEHNSERVYEEIIKHFG